MNEEIIQLAAAYLMMDAEMIDALAVALRLPIDEVRAVRDELVEKYHDKIEDMSDAFVEFGGEETSFLETLVEAPEEEDRDSPNEEGFNLYAEENNFRAEQFKDDYFGED